MVFIPTFPLAESIIAGYRTIKTTRGRFPGNAIRYHICAALDIQAVSTASEDEISVPLCLVNVPNLECRREPYDVRWFARLVTLLIFTLQALLTLVLWIRRAQQSARTYLDDYVAVTAFGGIINGLISVSMTLVNTQWEIPERYISSFHTHFNEPSPIDLFINFAWRTWLIELRAALVLGISILSAAFFTLRGYSAENDLGSLPCNMPMNSLWKYDIVPTSKGLVWMTMISASCHEYLDRRFSGGPMSEDIAFMAYILAFLSALYPVYLTLGLCAVVLFCKAGRVRRTSLSTFWWLINTCGWSYIALSYGCVPLLFGTSQATEHGSSGCGKILGRIEFGHFESPPAE